jgi:rhodanese-related sulfurtransferase
MRRGLSLFVAFTLIFILIAWGVHAMSSPLGTWPLTAKRKLARHGYDVVVDVRTDLEYGLGHYPMAVHIPLGRIEQELPDKITERRMRILFYCNSATRARWAAEKAQRLGYMNVEYLIGPHYLLF